MIAVIIPTLNEEKSIQAVVEGFPESYREEEIEIYVVDGGSKDDTVELAEESGARIIHQNLRGGKGNGVSEALQKIDAEIYVMIDGDGTYDPSEVGDLLDPIIEGKAGHVIGTRTNRENGALSKFNLVGNRIFNGITRLSTGKQVTDMLSGYRAFTKESLKYTDYTRPDFGIETEMTITALENHVPLEEVPITYRNRKGQSKLHPVKDGWRIAKTIVWSIRDLNPLKFFSTTAFLMLLLASYPAFLVIQQKIQTGIIQNVFPGIAASVLIIIGLQLLIFGMLADQIKNVEKRLRMNE